MSLKVIKGVVWAILILSLIGWIYLTFFYYVDCRDYSCFKTYMEKCEKARYINDEEIATWEYNILGKKSGLCVIEVTLLNAKKGEAGLSSLVGSSMVCDFKKGFADYPQKSLDRCSGLLKEKIQEIIINKMYDYLIRNLGNIERNLGVF